MRTTIVLLLAGVLAGCSLSPSADYIKALAGDHATLCWSVITMYGSSKFYRSGNITGGATCDQDRLTVANPPPPAPLPPTKPVTTP